MSILTRLAGLASAYIKSRRASAPARVRSRSGPPGGRRSLPGPPPVQSGGRGRIPPTGRPPVDGDDGDFGDDDSFDNIDTGRDYTSDPAEMDLLQTKMRRVASSNVYSYAYQAETPRMGILYVTFLEWAPKSRGGTGEKGDGPGATYAYFDFPLAKYKQFESLAESSAGSAVWDYCRVRHSVFEHQHTYRLISTSGEYVPRKATAQGFAARSLADVGTGKRGARGSSLAPRRQSFRRQLPRRNYAAFPNRGEPNRGEPNRG